MTTTYTFQRGEPIILGQRVVSGDPAGYTLTAKLKPAPFGEVPASTVASVADFDVTFTAAVGEMAAYWLLTIDADASADLATRLYVTDVVYTLAGETVAITDPLLVRLSGSVSV